MSSSSGIDLKTVLDRLWNDHRELTLSRLSVVTDAVASAESGALDHELRLNGEREAHKLAGSLGTFGLQEATEAARKIEQMLKYDSLSSAQLRELRQLLNFLDRSIRER
jgi:HPt (histidine-containing phosphotransfer) domain-containing protein